MTRKKVRCITRERYYSSKRFKTADNILPKFQIKKNSYVIKILYLFIILDYDNIYRTLKYN